MDGRYIEPRTVLWAVAEVCWQDGAGTSYRTPATLEDTSPSGACIRVQRPFTVGSKVTVKWHRGQFSAVTRNCRRDGFGFLLGVMRASEPVAGAVAHIAQKPGPTEPTKNIPSAQEIQSSTVTEARVRTDFSSRRTLNRPVDPLPVCTSISHDIAARLSPREAEHSATQSKLSSQGPSPRAERKVMQSKTFFPHFWRRPNNGDAPAQTISTEAPMSKPTSQPNTPSGPRGELLSYEDIYRAAGIMSPGSGYGIHKVVEMMNSERIRDLAKDVKRASVLMALDAAGISADELLTDATRRQNASAPMNQPSASNSKTSKRAKHRRTPRSKKRWKRFARTMLRAFRPTSIK